MFDSQPHGATASIGTARRRRHGRRSALKFLVGGSAGLLYGMTANRLHAVTPTSPSSTAKLPFPQIPVSILHVGGWPVGSAPNYCDAALVNGQPTVWVAAYASGHISRVDTSSGKSRVLPTDGALPLDVAYDRQRSRVVVASADGSAAMVVLDAQGRMVAQQALAYLTGQGPSMGGAQGVIVDRQGHYWFALSYYDSDVKGRGVIVKIDGTTFDPILIIKGVGLENPNGLLYYEAHDWVVALSETGVAHCFRLDGSLVYVHPTINVGYRGAIANDELWTASWSEAAQMSRTNLLTGARTLFSCTRLANSVVVDDHGRVWVAGDAGVSVSDPNGSLLAEIPLDSYANGLTSLGGRTFHVTQIGGQGMLKELALAPVQAHLPAVRADAGGEP